RWQPDRLHPRDLHRNASLSEGRSRSTERTAKNAVQAGRRSPLRFWTAKGGGRCHDVHLSLEGKGRLSDFIEEQGVAVRDLEQSLVVARRSREGALPLTGARLEGAFQIDGRSSPPRTASRIGNRRSGSPPRAAPCRCPWGLRGARWWARLRRVEPKRWPVG